MSTTVETIQDPTPKPIDSFVKGNLVISDGLIVMVTDDMNNDKGAGPQYGDTSFCGVCLRPGDRSTIHAVGRTSRAFLKSQFQPFYGRVYLTSKE